MNPVNLLDLFGLSSSQFLPLGGESDDTEVSLRDMFNMYKKSDKDKISVYNNGTRVSLNGVSQFYYYNTEKNGSVDGNRIINDRMQIDSVSFAKRFKLYETVSRKGNGYAIYVYNLGESFATPSASFNYNFSVSYVKTPRGIAIFNQSLDMSISFWNGVPGEMQLPKLFLQNDRITYTSNNTTRSALLMPLNKDCKRLRSDQKIMLKNGKVTCNMNFCLYNSEAINQMPIKEISFSIN